MLDITKTAAMAADRLSLRDTVRLLRQSPPQLQRFFAVYFGGILFLLVASAVLIAWTLSFLQVPINGSSVRGIGVIYGIMADPTQGLNGNELVTLWLTRVTYVAVFIYPIALLPWLKRIVRAMPPSDSDIAER